MRSCAAVGVDDDLAAVRPQSPSGPPMKNAPVGLMCQAVSLVIQPSGRALRS